MKNVKILFTLFSALFLFQNSFAQKGKITSAQMFMQEGKVMDAKREIDAALQNPEIQTMVKAWFTKGDVYKGIYETTIFYAQNPNCLFEAKDAYLKAYELETNAKKKDDVSTPLTMVAGFLFNEGLNRFNSKKNEDAYKHFDASRLINDFLYKNKMTPTLDTNAIFATAIAGANAQKADEVQPLLESLVEMDYDNPSIYETLAQIYDIQKNKAGLDKVVAKGMKKYPSNKNLQVYELNATLDSDDFKDAIDKFEKAAVNDPKNSSILFNLGVLYDKINNFEKAKESYEKAIAISPDYSDAYFNLGVMYFNDGVALHKKMNEEDDMKKYEVLKKQRDDIFLKALPNLEKAYSINPKNVDYKQNLKKVYASMNMLEKAKALSDDE